MTGRGKGGKKRIQRNDVEFDAQSLAFVMKNKGKAEKKGKKRKTPDSGVRKGKKQRNDGFVVTNERLKEIAKAMAVNPKLQELFKETKILMSGCESDHLEEKEKGGNEVCSIVSVSSQ